MGVRIPSRKRYDSRNETGQDTQLAGLYIKYGVPQPWDLAGYLELCEESSEKSVLSLEYLPRDRWQLNQSNEDGNSTLLQCLQHFSKAQENGLEDRESVTKEEYKDGEGSQTTAEEEKEG